MKKLFALLIIATVLISIPLVAAANTKAPVSKIVFVHRVGDFAKPDGVGNPAKDASDGYDMLGKNVKWTALDLTYVINPNGVISEDMIPAITDAAETWDAEVEATELFDNTVIIDYEAQLDTDMYDGVNEIVFGGIDEPNAIAMCVVWGRFVGPPSQREIIEFDIIFDCEDFQWGIVTDDNAEEVYMMDLQNIATHELGHALGLADLYADEWTEQTMYGYATVRETKKQTLDFGDIAGITALYGE